MRGCRRFKKKKNNNNNNNNNNVKNCPMFWNKYYDFYILCLSICCLMTKVPFCEYFCHFQNYLASFIVELYPIHYQNEADFEIWLDSTVKYPNSFQ